MGDALKEANGLLASFGTYTRMVIVGVWFPGFLLFCELLFLIYWWHLPPSRTWTENSLGIIEKLPMGILVAGCILVLASSIAAGYVARDIAFWISDRMLKHHVPPARTIGEIRNQLDAVYGQVAVDDVLKRYEVFKLLSGERKTRLPRLPESYVREYCKLWLRNKAPQLATEGLEIEINMVIGLIIPMGLAGIVLLAAVGGYLGVIVCIILFLSTLLTLYRINWARDLETEQALLYFLFAHWEQIKAPTESPKKDKQGAPA